MAEQDCHTYCYWYTILQRLPLQTARNVRSWLAPRSHRRRKQKCALTLQVGDKQDFGNWRYLRCLHQKPGHKVPPRAYPVARQRVQRNNYVCICGMLSENTRDRMLELDGMSITHWRASCCLRQRTLDTTSANRISAEEVGNLRCDHEFSFSSLGRFRYIERVDA